MIRARIVTLFAAVLLSACGGDGGTGPSKTYESVAGNYGGSISGVSQGVALDLDIAFTIQQNGTSFTGTYTSSGLITDGIDVVQLAGNGTISGTVAAGTNPSVSLTARDPACPNVPDQFTGTLSSANRKLTLSGSLHLLDVDCSVLATFPTTLVLTLP
ncbi:MAG TPA: hypothetical protein PLL69_03055 [Gemmatimonadales bacterium]|nr:hypothetical protein [Gemmatimonadales bacterium]